MTIPSGTVTFLFTDIEGSTQLAQAHPATWEAMRARHHALLRAAIDVHGGHVFQIIGDAFCAAFGTASDGIMAAVEAQQALQSEDGRPKTEDVTLSASAYVSGLPSSVALRVRMGIHTGAAEWRNGDYNGHLTLARVQRIMSAGHGEQVLLSQTTYDLVRGQLPDGVSVRDLGVQRLKDFPEPEHVYQLVIAGSHSEFPPPKTLGAFPNNLPSQLTSFIGREREIAEVKRLLGTTRLLTLTGVGGTGKTRLSLKVASDVVETFRDGVWLVELAPLADPALVPQAVASSLGVREQAGRELMATIADYLRAKQLLLILDNCEHLIRACAQLADALLRDCPHLKIIASTREALGIAGETIFNVPSLSVPVLSPEFRVLGQTSQPSALRTQDLLHSDSVRLFVDRAAAIKSDFQLTDANAG
ncbi:MAG: adenylate/guanylate cyclase domain-containing protein, partial [Chloroflexi bacterium]|nr:adenylate/guanylate cyclase domain-containing protein [Chloroflexota bacterium]